MNKTKAIPFASAAPQSKEERGAPLYLSPVAAGFPSPAEDYIEWLPILTDSVTAV